MDAKKNFIRLAICASLYSTALYAPISLAAAAPTLNLFPTSVVANLQTSSASAQAMDSNLETIVAQMQSQLQLYNDAQCGTGSSDLGCLKLRKGLRTAFDNMLQAVSKELPTMKKAIQSTVNTLGKRIHTELGRKMTPLDLELVVKGKKSTAVKARRSSVNGQKGMAKMFKAYLDLVSTGKSQESLAIMAADIYADSSEALEYINLLQMNIDQTIARNRIDEAWNGEPSDEMIATVAGVKALLYGVEEGGGVIPDSVVIDVDPAHDDSDYRYY